MVTETIARTALNASAKAYEHDGLDLDGYMAPAIVRGNDGFSALIYRQSADPSKALVAFAGTASLQDAFADINLGTNQWQNNRAAVFSELGSSNTEVVFTGHSLGGGLAQYAAYEFADPNGSNSSSQISVVTYNALGGASGSQRMHGDTFDPSRLANIDGAHFAETKDIVARLGNGHLGGEVIRHDLGTDNALRAHQLSGSFLQDGTETIALLSGQRNDPDFSYLQVDSGQAIAAAFANTANKPPFELVTPGEATVGLLRAAGGILLLAPDNEIDDLGNAILPGHPVSDWSNVRNMLGPVGLTGDYLADNGPLARETAQAILRQQLTDVLTGAVAVGENVQHLVDGVEATGERIGDLFDHAQSLTGEGAEVVRDAAQRLYLEGVDSGARAKQALLDSFETIDEFTDTQRQTLQNLYDDGSDWVSRQLTELPDRLEQANDLVISDVGEVFQDWVNGYQEAKHQGLQDAGEFLNEGLSRLRRIANGARNLVGDVALALPEHMQTLKHEFLSTLAMIPTISPLVVDLDGDGIELTPLSSTSPRFDLDADGFAEQTGWLTADDGLLVLDRDANGRIDSGAELFGNHTLLPDGSNAEDGFAALRTLDSNGDQTISRDDTDFEQLKIWRDLNGDTQSQAQELFSLEDLDIESISTDATPSTQTVAGHTVSLRSNYSRTDASTREIADVFFQVDQTNTRRVEDRHVSLASLGEANLRGYGFVDDLHTAMSDDPVLYELTRLVTNTPLDSSVPLVPQIERLIYRWTETDHIAASSRGAFDARKLTAMERLSAIEFRTRQGDSNASGLHFEKLSQTWNQLTEATLIRILAQHQHSPLSVDFDFSQDRVSTDHDLSELITNARDQQPNELDSALAYWQKVTLGLGALSETLHATKQQIQAKLENELATSSVGIFSNYLSSPHLGGTVDDDIVHAVDAGLLITGGHGSDDILAARGEENLLSGGAGADHIKSHPYQKSTDKLIGGTGDDVLTGSRFSDDYYFSRGDGSDRIDETAGGFVSRHSIDRLWLTEDIAPDNVTVTRDGVDLILRLSGSADSLTVAGWYQYAGVDGRDQRLESIHFEDGTIWDATTVHALGLIARGSNGNDHLTGIHYQDNTLIGLAGNDTLQAGTGGNDRLYGGDGDDRLLGAGNGIDHLFGEAGNDMLQSYANLARATQFYGGLDNDTLVGSRYADDYYFARGDGHDIIDETAGGKSAKRYPDRLFLSTDISPDDVSIHRQDQDLTLTIEGDGSSVTIREWYSYAGIEGRDKRLESVHFESGQIWDANHLHRAGLTVHGTPEDDTLVGLNRENNVLHGHGGNDTLRGANYSKDKLYGGDGDDNLFGGTNSQDKLFGGNGNDRLESYRNLGAAMQFSGNAGDDWLIGSRYADDYHFGLGDGHDVIDETRGGLQASTHPDRLIFADEIGSEDVRVHRDDQSIVLSIAASDEKITVKNWYHRAGHNGYDKRLEAVQFTDGAIWSATDVEQMALAESLFATPSAPSADTSLAVQAQQLVDIRASSTNDSDVVEGGSYIEDSNQTVTFSST